MDRSITRDSAPALGDVRQMSHGDRLHLLKGAELRPDWPRYLDAIAAAVSRGTNVGWI